MQKNLVGFFCLFGYILLRAIAEPLDFSTFEIVGNSVGPAVATSGAASTLTITPAVGDVSNAAWAPTALDVTRSFSITFTLTLTGTAGADGVALVLHNDPRARAA